LNAIEIDAGVLAYVRSLGDRGRAQLLDAAAKVKKTVSAGERAKAVFLLGELGWPQAFAPLRKLLQDKSASVRLNTIYALAKIDGPQAVPILLQMLNDRRSGITEQGHSLRCLAGIGDRDTLKALETWMAGVKSFELQRLAQAAIRELSRGLQQSESG
jgi:HEAT repeat protein